ncbi:Uncharacterised protein [Brucella melitensis]|nr:Uncharacterised protein [Brucella melitensis]
MVLFSLTPHGFGLGLNASIGVEQRNRAVEHTQRTLNFNREVNRRVDDVEAALLTITALPERGRSSRGDVIPRSCSCSIQSMVDAPSWVSPILWFLPV